MNTIHNCSCLWRGM